MTQEELECLHIGENLDTLMNLDPRGYGVSRILYAASRKYTKKPLTMNAAHVMVETLNQGDFVYIITGFILRPHNLPEMDGMVSSMLLARSLINAFGVKPVIICPEDNKKAVYQCAPHVGLHIYEDLDLLKEMPLAMGVKTFTKNIELAEKEADLLIQQQLPKLVISIEAPGSNSKGEYHNAIGLNVTDLEAKTDILFRKLQKLGVVNIAIGDLGNEIGMGTIAEDIKKYIPYTRDGECKCPCKGGILASSCADHIITATVSDWGCYGLMAALAYLKKDIEIFHRGEMEEQVMRAASASGLIDMTGSLIPGIDGFHMKMNINMVELMRQCVGYPLKYKGKADHWFESVLDKQYYQIKQREEIER